MLGLPWARALLRIEGAGHHGLDFAGNYPYLHFVMERKARQDDDVTSLCTCAALRQATRHVTRAYDEALAPVGLSLNQYAILAKLGRLGPQGLQELADRLVMDRSTLGRLLRPLERRDLVRIEVSTADRRGRTICLSREGATLLRGAKPLWASAEQRFEDAFGQGAAKRLRGTMKRITLTSLAGD